MVSESKYADYLEQLFIDQFGRENVEREVYTPAGRFCDFLIDSGLLTLAVEVENTSEDVLTNGAAQALLYSEELDAVPVCVYPSDEKDNDEELSHLSSHVSILEMPYEPT